MAKGFIVVQCEILDDEVYGQYALQATAVIASFGGKILVRGGHQIALEGDPLPRTVVIEFESVAAARTYYFSETYGSLRRLRSGAAKINYVLVEGC